MPIFGRNHIPSRDREGAVGSTTQLASLKRCTLRLVAAGPRQGTVVDYFRTPATGHAAATISDRHWNGVTCTVARVNFWLVGRRNIVNINQHFRAAAGASLVGACLFCLSCVIPEDAVPAAAVSDTEFGTMPDGTQTRLYTLVNAKGEEVQITNYGGIVVSLKVLDKEGNLGDVVLGYDNLDDYVKDSAYFGAIIGRYANRLRNGRFTLDGTTYELATDNNGNHVHGGEKGFDKVVWAAETLSNEDSAGLELTYTSEDGEEGYPGTLSCKVTYRWTNNSELKIDYEATTDKPTVVNLTNHSYFNLKDGGASSILDHELMLAADRLTPILDTMIPNGQFGLVSGTPLDFLEPTPIGARIDEDFLQLKFGLGYDLNYIINRTSDDLTLAARVSEPTTGRVMEVLTTEPGIQFYSGNFLDGHHVGKGGTAYAHRSGFCLETQHYPDSPNNPAFPSTVLRPGETYRSTTVYRFSAM